MRSDNFLGRSIVDYFYCYICDAHVYDCEHLLDDRVGDAERIDAMQPSQLLSCAYTGRQRILEACWKPSVPFIHNEPPMAAPPRAEELYLQDTVERRYARQTVRTVCRLPRVYRMRDAKNVRHFSFDQSLHLRSQEEQAGLRLTVTAMKVLVLKVPEPKPVAGLGGLMECQGCGAIGSAPHPMSHANCLWASLGKP